MEKCDFGRLLDTECHKTSLSRSTGFSDFTKFNATEQEVLLWRSGLRDQLNGLSSICNHHYVYFNRFFEQSVDKCCDVFMKHKKKVKGMNQVFVSFCKSVANE